MRPRFVLSRSMAAIIVLMLTASARLSFTQTRLNDRITTRIEERSISVVPGHLHPLAQSQLDQGRLDPLLSLSRITIMFKRTDEQQAALEALLREQQDPSSANYHQWLTPEEFGDRFGLSTADC